MKDAKQIGLLLPAYFQQFSNSAVAGMVSYAATRRDIHFIDLRYEAVDKIPAVLSRWRGDGLITRLDREDYKIIGDVLPRRKPIINIHPDILSTRIPSVGVNLRDMAQAAIAHFCGTGYPHVGVFGKKGTMMFDTLGVEIGKWASPDDPSAVALSLYQQASTASIGPKGLKPNAPLERWLQRLPKPIGLLTTGGYSGELILRTAMRLGYAIPEDIAVLSATDDEICLFAYPPISAFNNQADKIGGVALATLDARLNGGTWPGGLVQIPLPTVIERRSTGFPSGIPAEIRQAMSFIRGHGCEGIEIQAVLRNVPGLSRTRLYALFPRYFGRSPAAEILHQRLETAKRYLEQTNLRIEEIAGKTGFKTQGHLTDVFRKHTGVAPTVWRRKATGASVY